MIQKAMSPQSTCRLQLQPDRTSIEALRKLFDAYTAFLSWLDAEVPAGHTSDLVALHRNFYDAARARSGLPSQIVTLGFRDWAARRKGETVTGVPLDARLYSIKSVSTLSVAGLNGRILVPFRVAGYDAVLPVGAQARLVDANGTFELWAATALSEDAPPLQQHPISTRKETLMTTDTIVSRLGRLISGMAHAAVDSVEGVQPTAVLEQAIREIDTAADDVRVELGKATAERHRLQARRDELAEELRSLDTQVKIAVAESRDDLATVGIDRQLDIEAQTRVLDTLIADVDGRIAKAADTLDAVKASRREAEQRLYDFKNSSKTTTDAHGTPTLDALSKAAARVERAESAATRLTGVPGSGPKKDVQAIESLKALAREHAVKERLARIKADS